MKHERIPSLGQVIRSCVRLSTHSSRKHLSRVSCAGQFSQVKSSTLWLQPAVALTSVLPTPTSFSHFILAVGACGRLSHVHISEELPISPSSPTPVVFLLSEQGHHPSSLSFTPYFQSFTKAYRFSSKIWLNVCLPLPQQPPRWAESCPVGASLPLGYLPHSLT